MWLSLAICGGAAGNTTATALLVVQQARGSGTDYTDAWLQQVLRGAWLGQCEAKGCTWQGTAGALKQQC